MRKIWVLRYNNGTADVWDEDQGPPSWPYIDAFDVEEEIKELKSDYDELCERVAWMLECIDTEYPAVNYSNKAAIRRKMNACGELTKTKQTARKAVEELL